MLGSCEDKCSVLWRSKDRRKFTAGQNKIQNYLKFASGLCHVAKEAVVKFKILTRVSL